jgi:response regulator RpfG family c-di-GMP phosphodiesterase
MSEARARVLVVDDEQSFASLVSEILSESGYEVVTRTDPRLAAKDAEHLAWDAAVVDLRMPGMTGLELTAALLARDPEAQVIILTGDASLDTAVEGIQKGVFDYLEKGDLDAQRLVRSVDGALEKRWLLQRNRELLQRTQETNRLLKALHELSTELAAESHLDRLLDVLLAAARDLVGAERARVMLFRSLPETVVEVAAGDGADAIRGARLQEGEGLSTLALEKDDALLLERPLEEPRYSYRCDELPTELPGFIAAPLRHGSVRGALVVAGRAGGFSEEQRRMLLALSRQAAVAIDKGRDLEEAENFFTHICELLVSMLDQLDTFYAGHSRAVAVLSDMVSRRLTMSDLERRDLHFGALLHDIGKIRLPGLLAAGVYTSDEQRAEMRRHPRLGLELLRPITRFEGILPIVHAHHERWDGKGYPMGLEGEAIPLGARVVAVAEVFEAMTRERPEARRKTPDEALAELEACAGTQFEPRIVRLFVEEYRKNRDALPI